MKIVKDWLQRLRGRLFLPVSREQALEIAARALVRPADVEALACHDTKPAMCRLYAVTAEPCWYIFAPWDDHREPPVIRSQRVILVGKLTGLIHYDGSAQDEG